MLNELSLFQLSPERLIHVGTPDEIKGFSFDRIEKSLDLTPAYNFFVFLKDEKGNFYRTTYKGFKKFKEINNYPHINSLYEKIEAEAMKLKDFATFRSNMPHHK